MIRGADDIKTLLLTLNKQNFPLQFPFNLTVLPGEEVDVI